jgi:hypothetical protein
MTKETFDERLRKYRERTAARVTEIKGAIARWIEPHDNPADSVSITSALLDLALDRHVDTHDADGFDLIEAAYSRALERARGSIH